MKNGTNGSDSNLEKDSSIGYGDQKKEEEDLLADCYSVDDRSMEDSDEEESESINNTVSVESELLLKDINDFFQAVKDGDSKFVSDYLQLKEDNKMSKV